MYADDCILFRSGNNWNRMVNPVQSDLNNVHKTLLFGNTYKLNGIDYDSTLHQISTYHLLKSTNIWVLLWIKTCVCLALSRMLRQILVIICSDYVN